MSKNPNRILDDVWKYEINCDPEYPFQKSPFINFGELIQLERFGEEERAERKGASNYKTYSSA